MWTIATDSTVAIVDSITPKGINTYIFNVIKQKNDFDVIQR